MDETRLDAMTRALTTPKSRRTTRRTLLGRRFGGALLGPSLDALAGLGGWRAADDASARSRPMLVATSRVGRASLALLLVATVVAGLLAEVATEPAAAAFPGANGV